MTKKRCWGVIVYCWVAQGRRSFDRSLLVGDDDHYSENQGQGPDQNACRYTLVRFHKTGRLPLLALPLSTKSSLL
jgi:hypothetical protein